MSDRKQSTAPLVSREYNDTPEACARALQLLLKKLPASKEGAHPGAPDSGTEIKEDSTDVFIIPE